MAVKTSLQCLSAGKPLLVSFCAAGCTLISAAALRADIFMLHNEGQVRGQLVNADESPRRSYEVRTPGGGQLTLDATQVKKIVPQRDVEMDYDRLRLRARIRSTVNGRWPNGAARTSS